VTPSHALGARHRSSLMLTATGCPVVATAPVTPSWAKAAGDASLPGRQRTWATGWAS
jgi:hypothetical protein